MGHPVYYIYIYILKPFGFCRELLDNSYIIPIRRGIHGIKYNNINIISRPSNHSKKIFFHTRKNCNKSLFLYIITHPYEFKNVLKLRTSNYLHYYYKFQKKFNYTANHTYSYKGVSGTRWNSSGCLCMRIYTSC